MVAVLDGMVDALTVSVAGCRVDGPRRETVADSVWAATAGGAAFSSIRSAVSEAFEQLRLLGTTWDASCACLRDTRDGGTSRTVGRPE
jgi:hypothetical protein